MWCNVSRSSWTCLSRLLAISGVVCPKKIYIHLNSWLSWRQTSCWGRIMSEFARLYHGLTFQRKATLTASVQSQLLCWHNRTHRPLKTRRSIFCRKGKLRRQRIPCYGGGAIVCFSFFVVPSIPGSKWDFCVCVPFVLSLMTWFLFNYQSVQVEENLYLSDVTGNILIL